ncbi:hypothetical protein [Rathayibacter toxicus]|uniref:hypothetical protein n=1 Tax=Rathayibacter toxicus TaxID=145458 RepID=UPI000AE233AD|nr:hypothetical protein [Rathayibacter toxicus]QOD08545.1 hypothetical protein AYW78_01305 [Rathayibacter toxicus]QWL25345.1 hypothetical protein E2R32_01295 [Rathayibacter toxicus]QWL50453.1 hypothetical protein E2R44_01295 [Rathayibacter toxicus]
MESSVYSETLRGPQWMFYMGLVVSAIVLGFVTSVIISISHGTSLPALVLVIIFLAVFLLTIAAFLFLSRRFVISVDGKSVQVKLIPFRVMNIPISAIRGISVVDVSASEAGGLGWRITASGQYALWSGGRAVVSRPAPAQFVRYAATMRRKFLTVSVKNLIKQGKCEQAGWHGRPAVRLASK